MTYRNSNIKIKESKTYIEDDYESAYRKARKELGADLVLIDKKEVKIGGVFGLFSKKKLQIIFGVEAVAPAAKYAKTQMNDDREILDFLKKLQNNQSVGDKVSNSIQNMNQGGTYNPYQQKQQPVQQIQPQIQANQNMTDNDMEKLTEKIKKEITAEIKKELFTQGIEGKKSETKDDKYVEIIEKMKKNDIDELIIPEIIEYIKINNYSEKNYIKAIREYFFENIECYQETDKKKVIMLVGPTGVGKTTSCAKIAANKWKNEKQIAFITADTYRLEAISQLKGYANILKVNVEVINKADELMPAIEKFGNKDFIIMDTAGRSPRNKPQMDDLKEFVKNTRNSEIDVYLVLSATSKLEVLYDIIENFKYIGFSSFIFTKIDETTGIGAVLSIYKKYGVPISYITMGQKVPDDIELADKSRLADIFIERFR